MDKHSLATIKIIGISNPPLVHDNLIQGIKECDYLKKISFGTGLSQDWTRFQEKRYSVNNLNNRLKRQFYQKILTENEQGQRKLLKTLRNIILASKQSNTFPQSINENGIEITDKKEIA